MAVRPVVQLPVGVSRWVEIEAIRNNEVVVAARLFTVNAEQRVVHVFADDNTGAMAHHYADLRIGTTAADYPLWDPIPAEIVDPDAGVFAYLSDTGAGSDTALAWLSDFGVGEDGTLAWLSDAPQ